MTQARIICLVGMHRSGTSMIARLLNICGLELGPPEQLLKADKANPLGHFEHRGFLDVDRKLLKYFHASWHHPPDLPASWDTDPGLLPLVRRARALAANFSDKKPWGWKEPRASLFLPFWRQAVPNMRFLFCLRNPLEVAESLQKRNRIAIEHGAWLWYLYTLTSYATPRAAPGSFRFLTIISRVGMKRLPECSTSAVSQTAAMPQCLNPPSKASCDVTRAVIGVCARSLPCPPNARTFTSVCGGFLPPRRRISRIPMQANGGGGSSTVDSFIAALTCQAGFEYLSQRQHAADRSLTSGQRLKKFLNSMRSR